MDTVPDLPIPISLITQRYLLFDHQAVAWLRREHNICGVLIGGIPQSPSQNIFLGLPLELMPEEAELLLSKGIAFIVDDARAHDEMLYNSNLDRRGRYLSAIKQEAQAIAKTREMQKEQAFRKKGLKLPNRETEEAANLAINEKRAGENSSSNNDADTLFTGSTVNPTFTSPVTSQSVSITPATSGPLLLGPKTSPHLSLLESIPQTYPLFAHLQSRGYFLSPGLRFGCQYMAYPGDPLRYHSHFLVDGVNWDDEINLMDVVGGGRLGTGVKKGYLLGGTDPSGEVKTFSIEWAGM